MRLKQKHSREDLLKMSVVNITSVLPRFWIKVNKDGPIHSTLKTRCWEWTSTIVSGGYGEFWLNRGGQLVHRVSWVIHNGEIPTGMWVLHKCDNRCCVNPSHLFLGTYRDNIDDMCKKDRQISGDLHYSRVSPEKALRGETHGMSKLTEAKVRKIRRLYQAGELGMEAIGRMFGVSGENIRFIVKYQTWKHVQ